MVGENRFPSITLHGGGLVSETPEPSNLITAWEGDVVGYYTVSRTDPHSREGEGIQLVSSNSDTVWYHTNTGSDPLTMGEPDCPSPVGTEAGRILTSLINAGPIFNVNFGICLFISILSFLNHLIFNFSDRACSTSSLHHPLLCYNL